jgi:hypothetical protein
MVIACGIRRRSPGVNAPATSPRSRALSSAISSARAKSSLNSTSTPAVCRSCSDTLSSIRPRATCFVTNARNSPSMAASDCGLRSARSRWRWLTARIVTEIVARSSSRDKAANPVMLLIIAAPPDLPEIPDPS